MKAKMSLQNLRIFLLAIVTALALWQVSLRVQAQKVEKPKTAHPASAKRGSSSAAMEESSAAKMILGAPSGFAGDTRIPATGSGIAVFIRQRAASAYALPSERSEAASHATSNQG